MTLVSTIPQARHFFLSLSALTHFWEVLQSLFTNSTQMPHLHLLPPHIHYPKSKAPNSLTLLPLSPNFSPSATLPDLLSFLHSNQHVHTSIMLRAARIILLEYRSGHAFNRWRPYNGFWLHLRKKHLSLCYLTISSSAALFSFCLQFSPASASWLNSIANSMDMK